MNILCICLSATIQRTLTFESFNDGKVNRTSNFVEHASGKALNTARVITQLKEEYGSELWKTKVASLCPVGKSNKNHFMNLAKRDKLTVYPVFVDGATRQCWTLLDSKNHVTTELVADETETKPGRAEEKLLDKLKKLLKKFDAVILAGSTPKYFSPFLAAEICRLVKESGAVLLADFCGPALKKTLEVCTPDIIKINEEEFTKTFGEELLHSKTSLQVDAGDVTALSKKLDNVVVVTRGAEETWCGALGKKFTCPVEKITPVNTTACGDSFNAGFLIEYLKSGDIFDALKLGTSCAKRNALNVAPGWIE